MRRHKLCIRSLCHRQFLLEYYNKLKAGDFMAKKKTTENIYESTVDYSVINANIKKYRQQAGLTQAELAERSHITAKYLSRLENNYYKSHLHIYIQIANSLNISIYDLIGDTSNNADKDFIFQLKMLISDMSDNQKNMLLESINTIKKFDF